VRQDQLDDAE